jgi:hypothetical protein
MGLRAEAIATILRAAPPPPFGGAADEIRWCGTVPSL